MLKNFQWKYDYITNQWYHNTYSHRQPRRSNRIRQRRIPQSRTIPSLRPRRPSSLSITRRPRSSLRSSLRSRTIPSLRPDSIPRRSNRIRRYSRPSLSSHSRP